MNIFRVRWKSRQGNIVYISTATLLPINWVHQLKQKPGKRIVSYSHLASILSNSKERNKMWKIFFLTYWKDVWDLDLYIYLGSRDYN